MLRFVKGQFHEYQESTIGGECCTYYHHIDDLYLIVAAFLTQTVNLDDTTVKFEIWDTAGQENIL